MRTAGRRPRPGKGRSPAVNAGGDKADLRARRVLARRETIRASSMLASTARGARLVVRAVLHERRRERLMETGPIALETRRAGEVIDAHAAWCPTKHHAGAGTTWPSLQFRVGVELLRDRLLARSLLLTQGAQRARTDTNTYVLVLCVRGHIETTGSLAQLVLKLSQLRTGQLDPKQWKEAFSRLAAGAKAGVAHG